MPWSSATLRDNFQTIMRSIKAFREKLDKQSKYDGYFKNIEIAGREIAKILYQDVMPPAADQFISTASGGIKTALEEISGAKEGLQDALAFRKNIFEIHQLVATFSTNGGTEVKQKQELQKKKEEELIEIEVSEISVVEEDKQKRTEHEIKLFEDSALNSRLLSSDALDNLIEQIGKPSRPLSNWSKVKHTVNHAFSHYPKTTISGVSEISVGIALAVSIELYKNFGETANQWLAAQTGFNLRIEDIAPAAIAVVGTVQTVVALAKSKPQTPNYSPRLHQPAPRKRDDVVELDSIKVDENQEQRVTLLGSRQK